MMREAVWDFVGLAALGLVAGGVWGFGGWPPAAIVAGLVLGAAYIRREKVAAGGQN